MIIGYDSYSKEMYFFTEVQYSEKYTNPKFTKWTHLFNH